jgi:hypothetical protein
MERVPVYIGIDVARAFQELPLCVVNARSRITPLAMPAHINSAIPRGTGNKEVLQAEPFRKQAHLVVNAVAQACEHQGWLLKRVAIDAPAAPPADGGRLSEQQLARAGLSSFVTAAMPAWPRIRKTCVNHLKTGGKAAALPHANRIWMLYGFELFSAFRAAFTCDVIEVYPFAIVRSLLAVCAHKSTERGYSDQLAGVSSRTGWGPTELEGRLKATVSGSPHDRLDAFMAAWIASLESSKRRAFGNAQDPNDSIWVPAI